MKENTKLDRILKIITLIGFSVPIFGLIRQGSLLLLITRSLDFFNRNETINDGIKILFQILIFLFISFIILKSLSKLYDKLNLKTNKLFIKRKLNYFDLSTWVITLLFISIIIFDKYMGYGRHIYYYISFYVGMSIIQMLLDVEIFSTKISLEHKILILIGSTMLYIPILSTENVLYNKGYNYNIYDITTQKCERIKYNNGEYVFTNNGIKKISENMVFKKDDNKLCIQTSFPLLNNLLNT